MANYRYRGEILRRKSGPWVARTTLKDRRSIRQSGRLDSQLLFSADRAYFFHRGE